MRAVAPDRGIAGVFLVPVAQKAFPDLAFANVKDFAFLVANAIDALARWRLVFNPRSSPSVVRSLDPWHVKTS